MEGFFELNGEIRYWWDGLLDIPVVQENTPNAKKNDRFEHYERYADLHLFIDEGHEFSSYDLVWQVRRQTFWWSMSSDIGLSIARSLSFYPFLI